MNELSEVPPTSNELAVLNRKDLISVLQNSLYTGASSQSIELVLNYCSATGLDVMQKPVHIVPMSVKIPGTQPAKYQWQDIIMPGIGLYRIKADRSGSLVGMSEPEFGPMIDHQFVDSYNNQFMVSYPEWCKITIKKLVAGVIAEFTAVEYWTENYATAKNTNAPNVMWKKRPRGQISKCTQAQALRMAFPEIGSQPTAEEMEGKVIDTTSHSHQNDRSQNDHKTSPEANSTLENAEPDKEYEGECLEALPPYPQDRFDIKYEQLKTAIPEGKIDAETFFVMVESKNTLSGQQKDLIRGIK